MIGDLENVKILPSKGEDHSLPKASGKRFENGHVQIHATMPLFPPLQRVRFNQQIQI